MHEKGTYGNFEMWINRNGIDNILLITQLEKYGYRITYNTIKYWIVHNPEVLQVKFKRNTIICNRITYIDMRGHLEVFEMLHTLRNNF